METNDFELKLDALKEKAEKLKKTQTQLEEQIAEQAEKLKKIEEIQNQTGTSITEATETSTSEGLGLDFKGVKNPFKTFGRFLNNKWQEKWPAAIRFLTHPRNGVLLTLIALGIGVALFLAAPVLLPAAAPALATLTLIGFSWAVASLVPYAIRFINGLRIDKTAIGRALHRDPDDDPPIWEVLKRRAEEWVERHPIQLAVVLFGIAGLAVTLFFTISFFTGGIGALVIPAILAPLGLAPAIPLLLFNLLPLALANIMKGIMAETTSNGKDSSGQVDQIFARRWAVPLSLNNVLYEDNPDNPASERLKAALFWGKPKVHKKPEEPNSRTKTFEL